MSDGTRITVLSARPASRLRTGARSARARLRHAARPSGPSVVEANLISGLRRLGVDCRLNPPGALTDDDVGVISGVDALQWASAGRAEGAVRRIVAGPNIAVTPDDFGSVMCSPAIDTIVVPCDWVARWWSNLRPDIASRIAIWGVGIDVDYWSPGASSLEPVDCLVYAKVQHGKNRVIVEQVTTALRDAGRSFRLLQYGTFFPPRYLDELRAARVLVYLTETESQGLAQFEAWATGTPCLAWDPGFCEWKGYRFEGSSSSPYVTADTGATFRDRSEFPVALERLLEGETGIDPRAAVVERWRLEASAERYLRLFADPTPDRLQAG